MELIDLAGVIERDRRTEQRDGTRLPDIPVVLVQGPPGSGKTKLLDGVASQWERTAPLARLSLRGVDVPAYRVVIAVADYLARREQLPQRCFSRVRLASAALELPLPADDLDAQKKIRDRLRNRDQVQEAIDDIVREIRPLLPALLGELTGAAADAGLAVLRPVAWWITARRAPYRWRADGGVRSGIDGLVQLNRWFTDGQLAEVDRAFVDAFLADLRAVYRSWRKSQSYIYRPVLLLDDADTPREGPFSEAQLRFLDVLFLVRNQHREVREEGDPLIVVATTGTAATTSKGVTPGIEDYPYGRDVVEGVPDEVLKPTRDGPAPIRRLDLARVEYVDHEELPPGERCRGLANGHPWAFSRLSEAVEGLAQKDVDAESALTPAIVHDAIKMITRAWPPKVYEGLVTRSAIDEKDEATHQVLEEMLAPEGLEPGKAWDLRERFDELVERRLWRAPGSKAMHPFFRTILLSALADRSPESVLSWDRVFKRLARHHWDHVDRHRHPDRGWHAHYELARSGDVVPAARYLVGALQRRNASQYWLDDLDRITRAPRQRDHSRDLHYEERRQTLLAKLPADATEGLRFVTKIVAARWLPANHLGAADPIELLHAAEALSHLAERQSDGDLRDELFRRAAWYRERYAAWSRDKAQAQHPRGDRA